MYISPNNNAGLPIFKTSLGGVGILQKNPSSIILFVTVSLVNKKTVKAAKLKNPDLDDILQGNDEQLLSSGEKKLFFL